MAVDYKPFAADVSAAVAPQSEYAAAQWRSDGFPAGVLPRTRLNKALRQSSMVTAALAEALASVLNTDVLDDGDLPGLKNKFLTALSARLPFDPNATYPVGSIGYVLKGLSAGDGFGFSSAQLRAILTGSLTTAELTASLVNRINLIDAPTTGLVTRVAELEADYATVGDLTTALAQAQAAAVTAQQKANEAAVSAGAALVSETNTSASAVSAATNAATATTKAGEATTAATSAAGSASSASTSASAASNSANAAGASATAAANSATSASTSAAAANTSAIAANTSKLAAETAQAAASVSAGSAALSATSAGDSAAVALSNKDLAVQAKNDAQNSANAASGYLTTVQASATAASTAASAANQSKLDAEAAAANALVYRNDTVAASSGASGSASAAATSAIAAANSASAAQGSASAASGSASSAQTSANDAQASATAANSAKVAAETAQGAASSSAAAAAASASSASGSASSASTSATTASTAATTAGTSATAANTSASNAATSAFNANQSAQAAASWYNQTVSATGSLSAAVTQQAATVASFDGRISNVEANYVLKVAGTRTDGKKVFAFLGLAATASGDTGESQILLSADQLRFVPASDINASPKNMFILGQVGGVTTLVVPAAAIGDGSIGNVKIGRFIASDDFNGVIDSNGNITNFGTTGWAWGKGGQMVASNGEFRGTVRASAIVETGAVSTIFPVSNYSGIANASAGVAFLSTDLGGVISLSKASSRIAVDGVCRVQVRLNSSFGGRPEAEYPLKVIVQLFVMNTSNVAQIAFPFWVENKRHYMKGSDQISFTIPLSGLSAIQSVGIQDIKLRLTVDAVIMDYSQPMSESGTLETLVMQRIEVQTSGVAVVELKG